jgi:hypothetical protein
VVRLFYLEVQRLAYYAFENGVIHKFILECTLDRPSSPTEFGRHTARAEEGTQTPSLPRTPSRLYRAPQCNRNSSADRAHSPLASRLAQLRMWGGTPPIGIASPRRVTLSS